LVFTIQLAVSTYKNIWMNFLSDIIPDILANVIASTLCWALFQINFLTKNLLKMKSKKKQSGSMTYQKLISTWNLNRVILASKMEMPVGTFKNKLSETQTVYRFTESEEQRLIEVLRELAADIETVAGISFNNALATMAKKKI
jgi:hypothetical protein